MAFRIEISPSALGDLDALAEAIKLGSRSLDVARGWFLGALESIDSLAEMPDRCALANEEEAAAAGVRLLLHGRREIAPTRSISSSTKSLV